MIRNLIDLIWLIASKEGLDSSEAQARGNVLSHNARVRRQYECRINVVVVVVELI